MKSSFGLRTISFHVISFLETRIVIVAGVATVTRRNVDPAVAHEAGALAEEAENPKIGLFP